MVLCERCKKDIIESKSNNQEARKEFAVTCSACGKDTTVPFEPKPGWNVYCRDCYKEHRR